MPETGGLFIIDGESAGSTPWEFDSLSEEGSNTVALAAAAKNNGDYGYKITFDGTNDYAYGIKTFVEQTELYVRLYVYFPAGLDLGGAYANHFILRLFDGGTYIAGLGVRSTLSTPSTPNQWYFDYRFAAGYAAGLTTNTWHYIEIRFLQHGSAGGAEGWINGDAIFSDVNQAEAAAVDTIHVGAPGGGSIPGAADYLYIDDIKADTSYIGAYSVGGIVVLRRRRM